MPGYNLEAKQYNGGDVQKNEVSVPERPGPFYVPVFTKTGKFSKWQEDLTLAPTRLLVQQVIEALPVGLQLKFAAHISLAKHYLEKESPDWAKVAEILSNIDSADIPEEYNKLSELQALLARELPNGEG